MIKQEKLATKIVCQHCGRDIYIPAQPEWIDPDDKAYCAYCGCYSKVNGEEF